MVAKNIEIRLEINGKEKPGIVLGQNPRDDSLCTVRHDLKGGNGGLEYIDLTLESVVTPSSNGGGEINNHTEVSFGGENAWWEELQTRAAEKSLLADIPIDFRPETVEGMQWIATHLFSSNSNSYNVEVQVGAEKVTTFDNSGFASFMAWYLYGAPVNPKDILTQSPRSILEGIVIDDNNRDLVRILGRCLTNLDDNQASLETIFNKRDSLVEEVEGMGFSVPEIDFLSDEEVESKLKNLRFDFYRTATWRVIDYLRLDLKDPQHTALTATLFKQAVQESVKNVSEEEYEDLHNYVKEVICPIVFALYAKHPGGPVSVIYNLFQLYSWDRVYLGKEGLDTFKGFLAEKIVKEVDWVQRRNEHQREQFAKLVEFFYQDLQDVTNYNETVINLEKNEKTIDVLDLGEDLELNQKESPLWILMYGHGIDPNAASDDEVKIVVLARENDGAKVSRNRVIQWNDFSVEVMNSFGPGKERRFNHHHIVVETLSDIEMKRLRERGIKVDSVMYDISVWIKNGGSNSDVYVITPQNDLFVPGNSDGEGVIAGWFVDVFGQKFSDNLDVPILSSGEEYKEEESLLQQDGESQIEDTTLEQALSERLAIPPEAIDFENLEVRNIILSNPDFIAQYAKVLSWEGLKKKYHNGNHTKDQKEEEKIATKRTVSAEEMKVNAIEDLLDQAVFVYFAAQKHAENLGYGNVEPTILVNSDSPYPEQGRGAITSHCFIDNIVVPLVTLRAWASRTYMDEQGQPNNNRKSFLVDWEDPTKSGDLEIWKTTYRSVEASHQIAQTYLDYLRSTTEPSKESDFTIPTFASEIEGVVFYVKDGQLIFYHEEGRGDPTWEEFRQKHSELQNNTLEISPTYEKGKYPKTIAEYATSTAGAVLQVIDNEAFQGILYNLTSVPYAGQPHENHVNSHPYVQMMTKVFIMKQIEKNWGKIPTTTKDAYATYMRMYDIDPEGEFEAFKAFCEKTGGLPWPVHAFHTTHTFPEGDMRIGHDIMKIFHTDMAHLMGLVSANGDRMYGHMQALPDADIPVQSARSIIRKLLASTHNGVPLNELTEENAWILQSILFGYAHSTGRAYFEAAHEWIRNRAEKGGVEVIGPDQHPLWYVMLGIVAQERIFYDLSIDVREKYPEVDLYEALATEFAQFGAIFKPQGTQGELGRLAMETVFNRYGWEGQFDGMSLRDRAVVMVKIIGDFVEKYPRLEHTGILAAASLLMSSETEVEANPQAYCGLNNEGKFDKNIPGYGRNTASYHFKTESNAETLVHLVHQATEQQARAIVALGENATDEDIVRVLIPDDILQQINLLWNLPTAPDPDAEKNLPLTQKAEEKKRRGMKEDDSLAYATDYDFIIDFGEKEIHEVGKSRKSEEQYLTQAIHRETGNVVELFLTGREARLLHFFENNIGNDIYWTDIAKGVVLEGEESLTNYDVLLNIKGLNTKVQDTLGLKLPLFSKPIEAGYFVYKNNPTTLLERAVQLRGLSCNKEKLTVEVEENQIQLTEKEFHVLITLGNLSVFGRKAVTHEALEIVLGDSSLEKIIEQIREKIDHHLSLGTSFISQTEDQGYILSLGLGKDANDASLRNFQYTVKDRHSSNFKRSNGEVIITHKPTGLAITIPLAQRELDLFRFFQNNAGDFFTRIQLGNQAYWQFGEVISDGQVAVHLTRLRKAFRQVNVPLPISNIKNKGYSYNEGNIEDEYEKVGDLVFITNKLALKFGDQEVSLTKKEWDILDLLRKNHKLNKFTSKKSIEHYVWGENLPSESSLVESTISQLNKKLKKYLKRKLVFNDKGRYGGYYITPDITYDFNIERVSTLYEKRKQPKATATHKETKTVIEFTLTTHEARILSFLKNNPNKVLHWSDIAKISVTEDEKSLNYESLWFHINGLKSKIRNFTGTSLSLNRVPGPLGYCRYEDNLAEYDFNIEDVGDLYKKINQYKTTATDKETKTVIEFTLTAREARVLYFLINNPNKVFHWSDIAKISVAEGEKILSRENLFLHIKSLKRKIENFTGLVLPFNPVSGEAGYYAYEKTVSSIHNEVIQLGELRCNLKDQTVVINGNVIQLTGEEFHTLIKLAETSVFGREVSGNKILGGVEKERDFTKNILKLRKKIDPYHPLKKSFIVQVENEDYVFDLGTDKSVGSHNPEDYEYSILSKERSHPKRSNGEVIVTHRATGLKMSLYLYQRELDLFRFFLSNSNTLFTKKQLSDQAYSQYGEVIPVRQIAQHLKEIRKAFKKVNIPVPISTLDAPLFNEAKYIFLAPEIMESQGVSFQDDIKEENGSISEDGDMQKIPVIEGDLVEFDSSYFSHLIKEPRAFKAFLEEMYYQYNRQLVEIFKRKIFDQNDQFILRGLLQRALDIDSKGYSLMLQCVYKHFAENHLDFLITPKTILESGIEVTESKRPIPIEELDQQRYQQWQEFLRSNISRDHILNALQELFKLTLQPIVLDTQNREVLELVKQFRNSLAALTYKLLPDLTNSDTRILFKDKFNAEMIKKWAEEYKVFSEQTLSEEVPHENEEEGSNGKSMQNASVGGSLSTSNTNKSNLEYKIDPEKRSLYSQFYQARRYSKVVADKERERKQNGAKIWGVYDGLSGYNERLSESFPQGIDGAILENKLKDTKVLEAFGPGFLIDDLVKEGVISGGVAITLNDFSEEEDIKFHLENNIKIIPGDFYNGNTHRGIKDFQKENKLIEEGFGFVICIPVAGWDIDEGRELPGLDLVNVVLRRLWKYTSPSGGKLVIRLPLDVIDKQEFKLWLIALERQGIDCIPQDRLLVFTKTPSSPKSLPKLSSQNNF